MTSDAEETAEHTLPQAPDAIPATTRLSSVPRRPPLWRRLLGFRGAGAVLLKELIHLRRDPITLFIMFMIPMVQLTIFGFAIDMTVDNVPTVVYDRCSQTASRDFLDRLGATGTFQIVEYVATAEELEFALASGRAKVAVEIPPDFAEKLETGRTGHVLVMVDGSDNTVASQAQQAAMGVGLDFNQRRLAGEDGGLPQSPAGIGGLIEVHPSVRFNPSMSSTNFFVPGLVGLIMQLVTGFLTIFSVVRERENGTLEQLMATPVSKAGLMVGKLLPYAVIGFLMNATVLVVMRLIFDVPIHGDVGLLLLLSLVFLLPALGIGILISAIAKNQIQAVFLAFLTILPSVLLSGFIFPRASMPDILYWFSFIIPMTYYLEILRGIILRGVGMAALWDETLMLLCYGILLMMLSVSRFQKKLG